MKPSTPSQSKGNHLRDKHCWQCRRQFKTPNRYQNWCSAAWEKKYQNNPIDYPASPVSSERLTGSASTVAHEIDRDTSHLAPIRDISGNVLKEAQRRLELRSRIEAERGMPISDEEFFAIANRAGIHM